MAGQTGKNGNGGLLLKLIGAAMVPLLAAMIGFGVLKSDVQHNQRDINRVESQAAKDRSAIDIRLTTQLRDINAKLDRILENQAQAARR